MIRRLILATALFALPATAQTQDCVAAGILSVDSFSFGTQRIPRDPRNPASREQKTVTVSLRNLTAQRVSFTAGFNAPPVQSNFVAGQTFQISGSGRMTLVLANVLNGAANDGFARGLLRLGCG